MVFYTQVSDVQNVYDEVDEQDYSDRVQRRLDDDWIVDDGKYHHCCSYEIDVLFKNICLNSVVMHLRSKCYDFHYCLSYPLHLKVRK